MGSFQEILDTIKVATPQAKIDELVKIAEQEKSKNIELAIRLIKKAKSLSEEHFYTKGLSDSLILLGKIYQNISNYGGAMKAALQAKELCISQNGHGNL